MGLIRDLETLRQLMGEPKETTKRKIHRKLTLQAQDFIRRSPFVLLSTATAAGESTVSPKGDYPGFVCVHDEQTLYIPERSGNNLLFTLQNILENPRIGLLFMVPRTKETLRVHGLAELTDDAVMCSQLAAHDRPALLAIRMQVTEGYFHCGKALIRSGLWQPETWAEPFPVSLASEIAANKPMDEGSLQDLEKAIETSYQNTRQSER